jgi:hypothetical protein
MVTMDDKGNFRAVTNPVPAGELADRGAPDAALGNHVSPESASRPPVGISDALAAVLAKLDQEEIEYFRLNQIEGKTRAKCAAILGWNAVKTERVRRRLTLHLAKLRRDSEPLPAIISQPAPCDGGADLEQHEGRFLAKSPCRIYSFSRGNSLNPFYRERLSNGLFAWALTPSNEMNFPTYRIVEAPAIKSGAPMPNDLQEQLKIEQAKLARIAERLHAGRVAVESTERDLRTAAVELAEEMSAAVLADREPVPGPFEKRIARVQATLDTQRGALAGAAAAHQKQCEIVGGIEGVIKANHHADVIARARPMCKRFAELTDELGRLALEVRIELVGENVQPAELFGGNEDQETLRARFGMLFTMSNFLSGTLTMYSPKLRAELFKRYPGQMPENWRVDANAA